MDGLCVETACGRIAALTRPDTDNPNATPWIWYRIRLVAKIHRLQLRHSDPSFGRSGRKLDKRGHALDRPERGDGAYGIGNQPPGALRDRQRKTPQDFPCR
jgi:hypothetical protein